MFILCVESWFNLERSSGIFWRTYGCSPKWTNWCFYEFDALRGGRSFNRRCPYGVTWRWCSSSSNLARFDGNQYSWLHHNDRWQLLRFRSYTHPPQWSWMFFTWAIPSANLRWFHDLHVESSCLDSTISNELQ